jgi:hypothetical protein
VASTRYPIRPQDPGPGHLAQVHAADAGERQGGEAQLHRLPDLPLGGGDEGEVQVGVVDLDADVEQAPDDGGDSGPPGEGGGGDGHGRHLGLECPQRVPRDGSTLGTAAVTGHHTTM